MSLKLPNDKIVYNLPEQVGVNAENIKYLAEVYKDIDSIPAQYADLKEDYDTNIKAYFDDTMKPTFIGWTTTFNGWTNTLDTYLANMSSAAVGAIAGQDIAPFDIAATGSITANSIIENMSGYNYVDTSVQADITPIYVGTVKNGNKLTCVWFMSLTATTTDYSGAKLGDLDLPSSVLAKLYPYSLSGIDNLLDARVIPMYYGYNTKIDANLILQKYTGSILPRIYATGLTVGTTYLIRYEATFLLSDNLAS